MARTKKSKFDGSGYQKAKERIIILEKALLEAIGSSNLEKAKKILLEAWTKEQTL